MTNYKDIIGYFETAANLHKGVSAFSYGTLDQLDANTQNIEYSYIFLRPLQLNKRTNRNKTFGS